MKEIGEEFVRLREGSRSGAWSSLQRKLMSNMDLLVPEATSLKDFLNLSVDMENFLKTEQGSESMHPMQALEKWLNEGNPPSTADDAEGTIQ